MLTLFAMPQGGAREIQEKSKKNHLKIQAFYEEIKERLKPIECDDQTPTKLENYVQFVFGIL